MQKNTNIKNKLEKKIKGIQGEYKRIAFDKKTLNWNLFCRKTVNGQNGISDSS